MIQPNTVNAHVRIRPPVIPHFSISVIFLLCSAVKNRYRIGKPIMGNRNSEVVRIISDNIKHTVE